MIKKLISLALVACVFATALFAQVNVNPQAPMELDKNVRQGKLENGLTYYIMHNDKPAKRAEFYIVTNVGAVQEAPDQDGLAHFLEHMCFNGTKNFPDKGIVSYMESIGCKFGENINAGTGLEETQYMLNNVPVIRKGIIDSCLLILHDYAAYVENNPAEIDSERGVILEEKRTRDNAGWRSFLSLKKALFKGSKMEDVSLIGSEENLKNFKPESLVSFYKTWYRPDMQAIIVVGDINVDEVENTIKNTFSSLPVAQNPVAKEPVVVPNNAEPIISIFTDKEMNATSISYMVKMETIPAQFKGVQAAFLQDIMQSLIAMMFNERLNDIEKAPNAPFLQADASFQSAGQTLDLFSLSAVSKDGEGMNAFLAALVELERIKKFGFTDEEYNRAKTNLLRGYESSKDNAPSRKNAQLVPALASNFTSGTPYTTPEYKYDMAKAYLEFIPLQAINQVLGQVFTGENVVVSYQAPLKDGIAVPSEQDILDVISNAKKAEIAALEVESTNEPLLDVAKLKGGKIAKVSNGEFGSTIWTLDNGIEVVIKPTDFKKDEIIVKTYKEGGKSLLPLELIPSVEDNIFSTYRQNAGLSKFKQSQLSKMLAGKAVSVSPYMRETSSGMMANTSPKDLETMLQLLYLNYTAPRFEGEEFEVGFNQIKTILPNLLNQPEFAYKMKLMSALGGNSERRPVISEQMLTQVDIDKIAKAYEILYSDAAGSKVFITGNVDMEALKPLVEKYIGSLPTISKTKPAFVDHKYAMPKGIVDQSFEFPMQTPKTSVGMIYSANMKETFDKTILMSALNNVLNQLYTKTIREDEGGTYGVGVQAALSGEPEDKAMILIMFDTDVTKAPKLIELAKQGLEDIAKNGPNNEYVTKAKENLIKAFPEKQINNSFWLSVMQEYFTKGNDTFTNYEKVVNDVVTPAHIQKLVKEILDANNRIDLIMTPKK